MHILFVHQNFPAQFGHVAHYLVENHGFQCTFVSQRPEGNVGGIRKIQYHLKREQLLKRITALEVSKMRLPTPMVFSKPVKKIVTYSRISLSDTVDSVPLFFCVSCMIVPLSITSNTSIVPMAVTSISALSFRLVLWIHCDRTVAMQPCCLTWRIAHMDTALPIGKKI